MKASLAHWAWVNGMQQFADGLTNVRSRQSFADVLISQKHSYKYDPDYVAAKKQQRAKVVSKIGSQCGEEGGKDG
eukprot:12923925-Prorocentrum_lima.AAC.1